MSRHTLGTSVQAHPGQLAGGHAEPNHVLARAVATTGRAQQALWGFCLFGPLTSSGQGEGWLSRPAT